MGVRSLPKTVTRQRRGCDLNPVPSAPESGSQENDDFSFLYTPKLSSYLSSERRTL